MRLRTARVGSVLFVLCVAACSESESSEGDKGAGAVAGVGQGGSAASAGTGGSGQAGRSSAGRGSGGAAGSAGQGAGATSGSDGSAGKSATGGASGSGTGGDAGASGSGEVPTSGVIPDDRLVPWTGRVGVKGGIPERTSEIDCTAAPYNAHADGADTSAEIQACIDGIGANEVAFLPAGTYTLEDSIDLRSDKTLRGEGPADTILLFTADLDADVRFHGDYTDGSSGGISIAEGYEQGSSVLTLANTLDMSPGDHLYLSELNDESIPVVATNDNGDCSWCGIYGSYGERARLQLTEITAVSGDRVTIDPPLYFTFTSEHQPEALHAPSYVEYAGVENLAVVNDGDSYDSTRKPVEFQGAANSWLRNVRVEKCGSRCVDMWFDAFRNEIRDSIITGCFDRENSDNCYGLQIESGSANLVENVIFDGTADSIILVSASGNAFGYNLAHGVHRTQDADSWFWPDSWTHGAHSAMNLWEGNDLTALEWDYYWGSNSHNLAFRNRLRGMDSTVTYDEANLLTNGAMLTFPNNNYMSAVGNVLGSEGFHDQYESTEYEAVGKSIWLTIDSAFGTTSDKNFTTLFRHLNYDTVSQAVKHCDDAGEPGCQGGDGTDALPDSLYLAGKPGFFGSAVFPPVGPEVDGHESPIPAALCYEKTVGAGQPFDATDCY